MRYKAMTATKRGGPEVLQVVEKDLRPPATKEARVTVMAVPVCQDDYGLASKSKHHILAEHRAIPIDYRAQDFVEVIRQAEPNRINFVFNSIADEYFAPGLAVLRRGGTLVHYGGPQSFSGFLRLVAKLIWLNLLPNGKSIKGYGTHRVDQQILDDDWPALLQMLSEGKLWPVISARFPILEAAQANALLESDQVTGNVVLLSPELL